MEALKLNKINKNQLNAEQMNALIGGNSHGSCKCSCAWAGQGGSSTTDNGLANWEFGGTSTHGEIIFEVCCPPQ